MMPSVGFFVLILLQSAMVTIINASGDGTPGSTYNSTGTRVPALFIFGDSTADSGNNNNLYTIARSNYPPYGRDFDTRHATGRFSNGRMTTDFLAEFLRVPLVPPYLSPEANMYIHQGSNFASAGAGILNRTGDVLGLKISQWQQIDLFLERRRLLVQILGEQLAVEHLRYSIYYLAIGGNDFIHNYVTNDTDDSLLNPDDFILLLISTLRLQLQTLFQASARKMILVGTGPVGCLPHFLFTSNSTTGECVTILNRLISMYNVRLAIMIRDFNEENDGSHIIYRDVYSIVEQMTTYPRAYGFTVGNTACCGSGIFGGGDRCLTPAMVCEHPADFVWWDEYHPSHKANHFIASQVWHGTDPPINASALSLSNSTTELITFMNVEELVAIDLDVYS